jgi:hypothetical protein
MHPHATRVARFWATIDVRGPDECWRSVTGTLDRDGYAHYKWMGKRSIRHRVAYYLAYGVWPEPAALHTCDVPDCCNPAHIYPGTQAQNMADRKARGRYRLRGEASGHAKLTWGQVAEIRTSTDSAILLARRYGVNRSHIYRIKSGKQW